MNGQQTAKGDLLISGKNCERHMAKTTIHKPPTHKLRTSDEMTKALTVIEQHKDVLHVNADDEHVYVLADVVTQVLANLHGVTKLMQGMEAMHQDSQVDVKHILGYG